MSLTGSTAPSWGIGRAGRALLGPEDSFETISTLTETGAKAVSLLSGGVTRTQERIERTDRRAYAGISERITGKKAYNWNLEAYAMCAAAGVAPPLQRVFLMAGWSETVDSGVSVTYAPSITATDWDSGYILFDAENISMLAQGAYTEEFSFSFDGSGPAKMTGSGIASQAYMTGTTTLSGDEVANQTVLSVAEAEYFEAGGWVQVGADTNSGAGYKVVSVDTSLNTITIDSPGLATGASSGDTVAPIFPTITAPTGTPISGNLGTITVGGVSMAVMSGSITVSQTLDTVAPFGDDSYSQAVKVDHRIKVSLECYATNANNLLLLRSNTFANQSTTIAIGTTAPNRILFTMGQLEFDVSNISTGQDGGQMFTLEGIAKYSSGNDDLTIKFY